MIYIVDDDQIILDSLDYLLTTVGHQVTCCNSAESFYAKYNNEKIGCILLDICMQYTSGIELFDQLKTKGINLPVIFLTGYGDTEIAVEAIKNGAFYYFEKPINNTKLLNMINETIKHSEKTETNQKKTDKTLEKIKYLTKTELEVSKEIILGRSAKIIAGDKGISERTINNHLANIYRKLKINNAKQLAYIINTNQLDTKVK